MSNTRKSGLADSPLFRQTAPDVSTHEPTTPAATSVEKKKSKTVYKTKSADARDDTMTPRHRDTMVSRVLDTTTPMAKMTEIEIIRHAVKKIGREGGTFRFSEEEKNLINQAVYDYIRDHNIRTSGNEITRIAINFIFQEHKKNGSDSILHKVLVALHT